MVHMHGQFNQPALSTQNLIRILENSSMARDILFSFMESIACSYIGPFVPHAPSHQPDHIEGTAASAPWLTDDLVACRGTIQPAHTILPLPASHAPGVLTSTQSTTPLLDAPRVQRTCEHDGKRMLVPIMHIVCNACVAHTTYNIRAMLGS